MDQLPLPTSVEDTEALILKLYEPGPPQEIAKIQEALQRLQRSAGGWELANRLLASAEEKVRFFGALTFIVKLNTDPESLTADDRQGLLQNLVGWFIQYSGNGNRPLVIRKLCTTLVAYFLHFSESWTKCIRHLMYCLCVNQSVPYNDLENAPETPLLVQSIPKEKALAVLWFAAALAEEVGRTDLNSIKHHKFHERLRLNVDDVIPLIARGIVSDTPEAETDTMFIQEAMKCFQAWVLYSHRAFVDSNITLAPLQSLTKPAMMWLVHDELYEVTVEFFSDVLANYSRFFSEGDFQNLYHLFNSPWGRDRYQRLILGDFEFDSLQFGQFMLAFGDANVQNLAQNSATDPQSQQLLSALCGLLRAKGYVVNDDKIFVPALEFWSTFVETMVDFLYSFEEEKPAWFPASQLHIMQAIESCWFKIQFPPPQEFRSWDSVDRTGFKDARNEVADLLQQSYVLIGAPLFSVFVNLTLESLNTEAWSKLEASIYCLSALADCVSDSECDAYLENIFESSVFSVLTDPRIEMLPVARQTFLTFIDEYSKYFEAHSKYLPRALTLLFETIQSMSLAGTASKSILSLCSSCRSSLIADVGAFLQIYEKIAPNYTLDSLVKERIIGGIASVIQAMPQDELKQPPLEQLLNFIEADLAYSLHLLSLEPLNNATDQEGSIEANKAADSNYSKALEIGLLALRCLTSIGKGLQVPDDTPVDVENKANMSSFWVSGSGNIIQQRVISIIARLYESFPAEGDIVEAACQVFRTGFTEDQPGPFVFSLDIIVQFLLKADSHTPRLGTIISTACSLVTSRISASEDYDILHGLMNWVTLLLQNIGEPSNEPEIAQHGIDFLCRLMPTHVTVLIQQSSSSLEFLFMFTLKALTGNDPLPKFMAADFWTIFLSLKNLPEQIQSVIDSSLQTLGPLLAQALVFNIGGNAARSELDKLCEPLKKLISRQVRAKSWLETALLDPSFPSNKISAEEKRIFLQKLVNLRGAKGTNQVVRDLWLACRGSNFAYAS
ncbi:armadillo-type protein [Xylogone sp. PMI_703]|nr:armadillo-type protein [Xylogone sp. PMI_703]